MHYHSQATKAGNKCSEMQECEQMWGRHLQARVPNVVVAAQVEILRGRLPVEGDEACTYFCWGRCCTYPSSPVVNSNPQALI